MKLKSLYIKEYKNIKDQTFDFSNNTGYIVLIGENGAGKSNLLEAISIIIKGLLNGGRSIPFDYSIKYEIDGAEYEWAKGKVLKDGSPIKKREMQYPSSLIACYSGEELRLWHNVYENYHMHYFNKAINENYYVPKILYINRYCWEIALISLLCASDSTDVNDFLTSCLNINDISDVTISFTQDEEKQGLFKKHDAMKWFSRVISDGHENVNAKTLATMDILSTSALTQKQKKSKTIFQYLYLLSQPKRNGVNKVEKLINNISIKIGDIDFKNLSEGEKKLILVECIIKVLSDKNTLILFDEPDAHIHIARKKELLRTIESFEGQTILTTHSPIFINQMADTNIYPMIGGNFLPQEKRVLIQKIANNEINIIDSACVVSSKYVLITEGPDDIFHIKSAISAFSSKDDNFRKLEKVSFVFMGGAKEVDNYYNEILRSMYDTITKIVFVFDYDEEGREGSKMVKKLIDVGNDKLQYVFYHKTYPVPAPNLDFYLEDFFERAAYNDVQIPIFNGTPSFAELKKASTWANSIKKRIQKHKHEKSLKPNDYSGFKEFLNQLIVAFGL